MADAMSLCKLPNETMGAFNQRLRAACGEDSNPVTGVMLLVIDGEPLVTLFSELKEASDKDVADAKAAGDTELRVGDDIPESEPLVAQVVRVSAADDKEATKSQQRLEVLYERADGGVVELLNASGKRGMTDVTYILVSYLADDGEDEDEDDGEGEMENGVRTPVSSKS